MTECEGATSSLASYLRVAEKMNPKETAFSEFIPNKVCVKETNIHCPDCGGVMIRLAHNPLGAETFLVCEKGGCRYTIVDDIYLSMIDWWEQHPSTRSMSYNIVGHHTSSIREVFTLLEKTLSVNLDEGFKQRVACSGPDQVPWKG
jgi:hypothetical protein